jgi:serine/threonine-protein kinase RsbW
MTTMGTGSLPMTGTHEPWACRVRLAGVPESVGEARRRVRDAISAWGVPADVDAAVLVASELVTNAIRHGAGGTVTLAIRCTRGQLRIDVFDTSPEPPDLVESEPERLDEDGRGLVLVAALAATWGWYRTPGGGKAVHAALDMEGPQ